MAIINLSHLMLHFDFLYCSAIEVAKSKALLSLENLHLSSFEPEEQGEILLEKIQLTRQEINDFNGKEYVQFATSRRFLYKIYSARMLFFETNDEARLRGAFILHERLALLEKQYHYVMAEMPCKVGAYELNAGYGHAMAVDNDSTENSLHEGIEKCDLPAVEELLRSYQINELIACMVPEPGLLNQLFETNKRIESRIKDKSIPLNLIIQDIKHAYGEIYRTALENLKQLIESRSKDGIAIFINNQLFDIRYMENWAELDGYELDEHYKHFKHFLKEELRNFQRAKKFKQPDFTRLISKKAKPDNKPFSFGYQPGPRPLRPIVVAMNLKFDLFSGSTTVDDFMEVLMCEDLSKNTKIIQVGLKYHLLYYFIKKLKPWCSYLRPANIGRSGIFVSLNEGPITAASLYNSGTVLLEDSNQIDAIFNAKYR